MNWNSWAEPSLNKARSNNPVEAGGREEALSLRRSDSTKKKNRWALKECGRQRAGTKNCNDNKKKFKKPD